MTMKFMTTELIKKVMKKIYFILALAASVMLACQKEENFQTNDKMSISVTASYPQLENETDTKTYISEKSILWGKGEQMAIAVIGADAVFGQSSATDAYDGQNVAEFQFSIDNPTPSATGYVYAGIHPAAAVVAENNTDATAYKVEVPAVQSATASSYDPDAYVLVAKPDTFTELQSKWTASYRRAAALNKITLTGISAAVSSVKISAPAEVALTGIRNIDLTTGESGEISSANNTVEITYSEPVSGANIDVWFASWGVELPEGSELVFEVSTGYSKYTRTITARAEGIKFAEGGLNTLTVNMSADDVVLDITDRYAAYNAGETIYVAGKAYSKAVNGEAKLITATTENNNLSALLKKAGSDRYPVAYGVYFLETPQGTTFDVLRLITVQTSDLVLISRYEDANAKVKISTTDGYFRLKTGLAMSGIDLDFLNRNNYLITHYDVTTVPFVHLESCKFNLPNNKPVYLSATAPIASVRVQKCTFNNNTTVDNTPYFNFNNCTNMEVLKEVIFNDNISYNKTLIAKLYIINSSTVPDQTKTVGGEVLQVKNNLFYNCMGQYRFFNLWHMDTVEVDKNVIIVPGTSTANTQLVRLKYTAVGSATEPVITIGSNITFGAGATYTSSDSDYKLSQGNMWTKINESPLAGDPTKGDFSLVPAYKDYGPRM